MDWFNLVLGGDSENAVNILLFHCTADRDPSTLLSIIAHKHSFQSAIFCPTMLFSSVDLRSDNANLNQSTSEQWQKCLKSQSVWNALSHEVSGLLWILIFNVFRTAAKHLVALKRAWIAFNKLQPTICV
jgi:hypothetical protein